MKKKTEVFNKIKEEDGIRHSDLAEYTDLEWHELTNFIRELRNEDKIRINLERGYEAKME